MAGLEHKSVSNRWFMHRTVHIMLTGIMLWLALEYGLDNADNLKMKSYKVYQVMTDSFGFRQWACFCFCAALAGVLTVGAENWRLRVLGSAILSASHAIIATYMILGNPYATITGLFVGNACLGAALAYSTAHLGQRMSRCMGPANIP